MSNSWTEVTLHPVSPNPRLRRYACGDHFVNVDQSTGGATLFYQGRVLGSYRTRELAQGMGDIDIAAMAAAGADDEWMSGWTEETSAGTPVFIKGRVRIWRSNGNMLAFPGDTRVFLTSVVTVTHEEAERGNKLVREEGGMGRTCGRHETLEAAKAAAAQLPVFEWVAADHAQYKVRKPLKKITRHTKVTRQEAMDKAALEN